MDMRKIALLFAASLVFVAACTKEKEPEGPQPGGQKIEITASFADKTTGTADGRKTLWNPDDSLNVFYEKSAAKFRNTATEPSEVSVFASDTNLIFHDKEGENYIWGVYPYSASNTCDGKSVCLTVPSLQLAAAGAYADGSFPLIGRSQDMKIGFFNVCGGLKFKLERADIEKIEFRGNSGDTLSGSAKVSFDAYGYPVVESVSDARGTVVLTAAEGASFQPGTYYYLSVLPGILEGGCSFTFFASRAEGQRSFDNKITIKRNTAYDFGTVDKGVKFIEKEVPVTEVSLNCAQLDLEVGGKFELVAGVLPSDATEIGTWSSTDTNVATVDQDGNVTATGAGTAAVSIDFKNASAVCTVSVTDIVTIRQIDALERELKGVNVQECTDTLAVARGEAASLEFVISSAGGNYTDLVPEVLYFNAEGRQDAGFAAKPKLYWARQIKAGGAWDEWAGGTPSDEVRAWDNMYPDPLWPVEDCGDRWKPTLSKTSKPTLWCDIEIPHNIPAGVYSGLVRVDITGEGGTISLEKEFAVKVYDVDLPEEQSLYIINWNDGDWWYCNGGKYPGTETVQGYIDQTVRLMNDFGQNVWRVDDHRVDNVPASLDKDGNMVFDFSGFVAEAQHFIDLCPKMKMIHGRAFAETYPEDLGVNAWYIENDELKNEILLSGDPRVQTFLEEYAKQLGEELKKHTLYNGKTWLESFAQSIRDEPEGEYIPSAWSRIASAMKKGCPELKFVEAIQTDCIDRTLIDYPCPTMNHLDEQRAQAGQTQWLYVCVQPQGNYANRFIRLPLLKDRYIYWCHFKYNAPGGLHWGLRYWLDKENPYAEGYDLHQVFPAGDYCILYPGYKKIYPSIRACVLRDGIRDYDLLRMVEARDAAKAQEFLGTVVRDADDMITDRAIFRAVRKEMLEYLSE